MYPSERNERASEVLTSTDYLIPFEKPFWTKTDTVFAVDAKNLINFILNLCFYSNRD